MGLMYMHPSKDIIGTYGDYLKNTRIALCITGSVAAYKAVDLARRLMRYGADVVPFMTEAATKIISPDLMHWATGNKPVTELTGNIEHVMFGGQYPGRADLILIYPATANTIAKLASGIADTPVAALAITALGSNIPIIIVPAMHLPLYVSQATQDNINRLRKLGIDVVEPLIEEGKAKIPDIDLITDHVITTLNRGRGMYSGKNALVLGGPTIEYIDPVRIITNLSSGRMALEIAKAFRWMGGDVKLIHGPGTVDIPSYIPQTQVYTTREMFDATKDELGERHYNYVFIAAAPADYRPAEPVGEKLSTYHVKRLSIELVETEKISDMVKEVSPESFLVIFKAEYNVSRDELIERAYRKLMESNADLVVANDVSKPEAGFRSRYNEVLIIDRERNVTDIPLTSKDVIARRLLDIVAEKTLASK